MELGSKNLSVAIGFIGKTTNALSLKCMMEFDDIVKTFGSKTVNMIEAKPLEINYLLGREWELPQINKPETKYPTSSSIYHNKDGSASITFGNYKTINVEPESDSETESEHVNVVSIEEPEIVLNIETVENLYRNSELIDRMLEEFEDPKLLDEPIDKENFIDIMCNNYLDDQIISKLYHSNLVKKFLDIEVINQFIIQPHIQEKEEKINEITEISKEREEKIINEKENKIEKEFVNVKTEIFRQGPQFKTRIEPSSSYIQPINEYRNGPILDIDNTSNLRKTIENWEQSLNSDGVIVAFQNQQEIYEYCKSTLRGTVLQFFRNMEQENSSYFQEVRNNFSISVFINLIKLYFLGTTQEDVNEPVLYLYKFEQLKLCNLSYIKEYEQKFRKYAILAKIDRIPEYLNKYILKIQGPVGVRLWNEFSTSEYKNSPYIGSRVEFVKNWLEKECLNIGERNQIKEQDLNRQLCRRLNLGEDLDLGCRNRYSEYRKPRRYTQPFRRKSGTYYRNQPFNTKYRKPGKYWIKRRRTNYSKNQCKCYLCGQVGHIKPECPELKKLPNEQNRKTQIKIILIKEYEINSDNEELISELDFESDNSSIYSLDDEIEELF